MIHRIIQFPLTRIILGLIFIGVGSLIVVLPSSILLGLAVTASPSTFRENVAVGVLLLIMLLSYALYVRIVERRPVSELALGHLREVLVGLLIGTAIFSLIIGVLWLLGVYRVTGSNVWTAMFGAVWIGIFPGISEELMFRGVLHRILEESLGTWTALLIVSLFFGFAHISNPGATVFSSVAIALEAGLMLGMAYTLTRRLWLPMGLHAAWNFVQGGVYGVNVSGLTTPSWLNSTMTGPELLSGGSFGAEASLVSVGLCLGLFLIFLILARRRGHIVQPFWVRRRIQKELGHG